MYSLKLSHVYNQDLSVTNVRLAYFGLFHPKIALLQDPERLSIRLRGDISVLGSEDGGWFEFIIRSRRVVCLRRQPAQR
jgi:hypothetical protein